MLKIDYLQNFAESKDTTEVQDIFVPYKGILRVSKLRYIKFDDIWKSLSNLMSFDTVEYNANTDMLLNIVLGLDSLWEGLACIIVRDIEIKRSTAQSHNDVKKILLPVCRFSTTQGYKAINHIIETQEDENIIFFNGKYRKLANSNEVKASLLLGISWSNLITEDKGFYAPQEYVSFIIQQMALLVASYLEKEPSQYLIMQTEAMKKSIYSNWDSIYQNHMPELEKQDMGLFMGNNENSSQQTEQQR